MEYSSIFNFCSVTSANLTKVYRMKEFFSSFFSSANIIVRAKVLKQSVLCLLLPLQGAGYTAHYTQGAASLALGYELLPLWGVPVSPHAKPRHVAYFHTYYSPPAKNPCRSAAPTARSVLLTSSPHGICAYLRDPWENKNIQPVL